MKSIIEHLKNVGLGALFFIVVAFIVAIFTANFCHADVPIGTVIGYSVNPQTQGWPIKRVGAIGIGCHGANSTDFVDGKYPFPEYKVGQLAVCETPPVPHPVYNPVTSVPVKQFQPATPAHAPVSSTSVKTATPEVTFKVIAPTEETSVDMAQDLRMTNVENRTTAVEKSNHREKVLDVIGLVGILILVIIKFLP